jgi:hypothetical protein
MQHRYLFGVYGLDCFFVSKFYDTILRYSYDVDTGSRGCWSHIMRLMERIMPEPKPLSRTCRKLPRFLIGRDSRGRWVVQDQWHLSGGRFIERADAIRYRHVWERTPTAGGNHGSWRDRTRYDTNVVTSGQQTPELAA